MKQIFSTTVAGKPFSVEVGELAQLANGSANGSLRRNSRFVHSTASAKPREGVDFFPLSVDYEEKLYSVGKIPGKLHTP